MMTRALFGMLTLLLAWGALASTEAQQMETIGAWRYAAEVEGAPPGSRQDMAIVEGEDPSGAGSLVLTCVGDGNIVVMALWPADLGSSSTHEVNVRFDQDDLGRLTWVTGSNGRALVVPGGHHGHVAFLYRMLTADTLELEVLESEDVATRIRLHYAPGLPEVLDRLY